MWRKAVPDAIAQSSRVDSHQRLIQRDSVVGSCPITIYLGTSEDRAWSLDELFSVEGHGDAFGAPGTLRISYATADEKLKTAVARIAEAVALLQ